MPLGDQYRPQYHFTPPQNWMNDPNGLVFDQGEYHLYYQHNPYATAWGHMSWGHAVSPNLVHWTRMPIALYEEPAQGYTIFSGSAVADRQNTSGFGGAERTPFVAVYTADHREGDRRQDVHIAYSLDRGRTFCQYTGNPVIRVDDPKFGDPKVFWHTPSASWVMVNILHLGQGKASFYGSPDLKQWMHLSDFEAPEEAPGTWECPDLFPMTVDGDADQVKWVLKVNCMGTGRASRYFVGDFDGRAFRQTQPALSPRPDNDNYYAEVSFNGLPQGDARRIMMGWLPQESSEKRCWTGAQSLPRDLRLRATGDRFQLLQQPVRELEYLRRKHWSFAGATISGESTLLSDGDVAGGGWELSLEAALGDASEFGLSLITDTENRVALRFRPEAGELSLEGAGASDYRVPWRPARESLNWRVFVDRSIIEIYAGEGERVISAILAPDAVVERAFLHAKGGPVSLTICDVWSLDSAQLTTNW